MKTTLFVLLLLTQLSLQQNNLTSFSCTPGVEPSVGVSLPRGDSYLTVNQSLALSCHLSPSTLTQHRLSFRYNHSFTPELTSSDSRSISVTFRSQTPGVTQVDCLLGQNTGVCKQLIYVGWPPQLAEGVSCVSDDWETLECSWREPYNPVPTTYSPHLVPSRGRVPHYMRCLDRAATEAHLTARGHHRPRQPGLGLCYLDEETVPPFRPSVPHYSLYINASNALLPSGRLQKVAIRLYSLVRPGPVEDISLTALSPSSLDLLFSVSKPMRTFPPGLRHSVRYRSQWDDEDFWKEANTSGLEPTAPHISLLLPHLAYPFTEYTVEIKVLPRTDGASHWSPPVTVSGHTLAAPPLTPPLLHYACFESVGNRGGGRDVTLYWQRLPPQQHNGPHFSYTVEGKAKTGADNTSHTATVDSGLGFVLFKSLHREVEYTFSVYSTNEEGSSLASSDVLVPPFSSSQLLLPEDVTKVYLRPHNYRVVWQPPAMWPHNYTVFWCSASEGDQCSGDIKWVEQREEHTSSLSRARGLQIDLTVEGGGPVRVGVAASSELGVSSGVAWARCTVIQGRVEQARPRGLSVDSVSSDEAWLSWRLDCSEGAGLVHGYVVTACSAHGPCHNVSLSANGPRHVSHLSPYTLYNFTVSLSIKRGVLGPPSLPVTTRTLSAAPTTAPNNLQVTEVTASSAKLSWTPPLQANGEVGRYEVSYSHARPFLAAELPQRTEVTEATGLLLTSLTAYTEYSVSVRACTEGALPTCWGPWSDTLVLRTGVGTPGTPHTPNAVFLNSSSLSLSWSRDFQLGAKDVSSWQVMVAVVSDDDNTDSVRNAPVILQFEEDSSRTSAVIDLSDLVSYDLGCDNSSFSRSLQLRLRAEVEDKHGVAYLGPWSKAEVVQAYCGPNTPWLLIVLTVVLVTVALFLALACLGSSSRWFARKRALFSRIGKGLEASVPWAPPLELDVLGTAVCSDQDQAVLLSEAHKSVSSCSRDSGVSACTTEPPAVVRRESSTSGYLSMARSTSQRTASDKTASTPPSVKGHASVWPNSSLERHTPSPHLIEKASSTTDTAETAALAGSSSENHSSSHSPTPRQNLNIPTRGSNSYLRSLPNVSMERDTLAVAQIEQNMPSPSPTEAPIHSTTSTVVPPSESSALPVPSLAPCSSAGYSQVSVASQPGPGYISIEAVASELVLQQEHQASPYCRVVEAHRNQQQQL